MVDIRKLFSLKNFFVTLVAFITFISIGNNRKYWNRDETFSYEFRFLIKPDRFAYMPVCKLLAYTRVNANFELGGFHCNNCQSENFVKTFIWFFAFLTHDFNPNPFSWIKWIFVLLQPNTFNIAFPWIYVNLINFVRGAMLRMSFSNGVLN